MLNRLPTPRETPPLSLILEDIGRPAPAAVARALGVAPCTVSRWIAADDAPRLAALALFWLTRWGMSRVDCEAVNAATLYAQQARGLADELAQVRAQIARLARLGDYGSANDPVLEPAFVFQAANVVESFVARSHRQALV